MSKDRRPDTHLVEAGRRKEWRGPVVSPPVWRGSTVLFDSVDEMRAATPGLGKPYYGLHGTATHWALAEALTELEPGAKGTMLYPNGLAAITAALLSVVEQGDELLIPDNVYGPTRRFCDQFLTRYGVATRYYDPLIGGGIAELIGDKTRAILLESPGSLTMEVQDVPAICTVAKARGLFTLIDNTWATPLYFPAIAAGVDLTILAGTKYVGGHADVMLGSVTANDRSWAALERTTWNIGFSVSADDAWLATRGLRTMGVRLRQHELSALKVARWLDERPEVGKVLHPALPSCPGHELWKRDFKGSTGLFSFVLEGVDGAARDRFIDALELFGIGYSWGGFESLAVPADPPPGRQFPPDLGGPAVRLHIGLEDADDLIEDLAQAFDALR
jgi:cystathionine beta-lyase